MHQRGLRAVHLESCVSLVRLQRHQRSAIQNFAVPLFPLTVFAGKCREPFWQGNYSCPNGDGTRFWDFDCPPADNFTGCGSYCMNECDTTCKGYRRPEVVIDVFTDEGCTNQVGDRVYVDQPCTSIASGAAIGIDSFVNGTYHETVRAI